MQLLNFMQLLNIFKVHEVYRDVLESVHLDAAHAVTASYYICWSWHILQEIVLKGYFHL